MINASDWDEAMKLLEESDDGLRAVPGASAYEDESGKVIYNMLDPMMGEFMGRCIGAVKKSGITAKGTGQFSILLGENQDSELSLDQFWTQFQKSQDQGIFGEVAEVAQGMVNG